MKLKKVGFYKELKYGDTNGESLKKLISSTPQNNEKKIIDYLNKGIVYITSAGISMDVIGKGMIGSPDILTDGVWCWSKDLIYYIKKYHVRLPENFIEYIMQTNFTFPKKENINLKELEF